jgi:hypothetical protein
LLGRLSSEHTQGFHAGSPLFICGGESGFEPPIGY